MIDSPVSPIDELLLFTGERERFTARQEPFTARQEPFTARRELFIARRELFIARQEQFTARQQQTPARQKQFIGGPVQKDGPEIMVIQEDAALVRRIAETQRNANKKVLKPMHCVSAFLILPLRLHGLCVPDTDSLKYTSAAFAPYPPLPMTETQKQSTVTNTRRGDVHRWSRTIIPTTREAPSDAEVPSHVLLYRAGFIRAVGAGIYDYLPLALRVINKVSAIIRDELNAAGSTEMLMPALEPFELFADTKRDETYGDNLFRVKDRKGRMNALAPTHEEVITELMKSVITSYTQLPITLYQIQTKFRDEARPRAGLLRCREFLMKDAYSFHMNLEGAGGLNDTYDAMFKAYSNTFTRCGLDFLAVEAESGPIGGSASHEFMVRCASGEDTVLRCSASGYAANVEKCEIGERPRGTFAEPATGELTEVHTPNLPGIDDVGKFMKVKPDRMLKSIVFARKGTPEELAKADTRWVVAVVRGDHDVNEGKVRSACGFAIELAPEQAARAAGFAIGYVSPKTVNSVPGTMLLIDSDASLGGFWASGADKTDYHVKHFNWRREVGGLLDNDTRVKVGDIRNAVVGDPSPRAPGSKLEAEKGIEVGHIFKLGTKYSQAMGLLVLDDKQQRHPVIMGCYGIGVSRTMAACVEMSHDNDGIIWPFPIAPYHVLITIMKPEQVTLATEIAGNLAALGIDVLIDDRDERPGVKFKDADLVGVPIRITIGDKALAEGSVEYKLRKVAGKGELVKLADIASKCLSAING